MSAWWRGAAFAAIAATSSGILANLFFCTFVPGQARPTVLSFLVTFLLASGLFGIAVWRLKGIADEVLRSRARVSSDPSDPRTGARPVLIMGLSRLQDAQEAGIRTDIERIRAGEFGVEQIALPVREFAALKISLNGQGKAVPADTPWQQNIRAMWFHASPTAAPRRRLRKVLILPSAESLHQFARFKEYAEVLFGPDVEIDFVRRYKGSEGHFSVRDSGVERRDYDHYEYVRDGLDRATEQAKEEGLYGDSDICIDATPGQKPFSIAAAILTLNSGIVFSYVTTAQAGALSGGEVKLYDMYIDVTGSSPS